MRKILDAAPFCFARKGFSSTHHSRDRAQAGNLFHYFQASKITAIVDAEETAAMIASYPEKS